MHSQTLKVGDLAARTGVSVRTLHHYDELGLVRPSLRTESGYRLYTPADVARLQQVLSLRQLGLSLGEVARCLAGDGFSPVEVIRRHLAGLRERIALERELCNCLEGLERVLGGRGEEVSPEEFLHTIEVMAKMENYYSPEQMEYLKRRREEVGEGAIRAAESEWPGLIARVKAEMDAGTDPADARVQALARRWHELIEAFTGGDEGVRASLGRMWKEQGAELARSHNLPFDPRLMEYVGKAQAAARLA